MSIVPIDLQKQGTYEQLFRGNYNKGLRIFKSCMIQNDLRAQLIADTGALNCVFTNVNYAAASGKLALAMNEFDDIVPAFNTYCASKGIAVKSTLALTWADAACKAAMMSDSDILTAIRACSKLGAVCQIDFLTGLKLAINDGSYATAFPLGTSVDLACSEMSFGNRLFPAATTTFEVIGHDQDVDTSGNTLPITFATKRLHTGTGFQIASNNEDNTFVNSFPYLQRAALFGCLPADWRSAIATTRKRVASGGSVSTLVNYDAAAFIFREREILGTQTHCSTSEYNAAFQYQSFTQGIANKNKDRTYWLASPRYYNTRDFAAVTGDGSATYGSPNNTYGLCFGFALKREQVI